MTAVAEANERIENLRQAISLVKHNAATSRQMARDYPDSADHYLADAEAADMRLDHYEWRLAKLEEEFRHERAA